MERLAGRTFIVWIFMLVLIFGMLFFFVEYSSDAEDWVLFPGSQHVYDGLKLADGVVTDRDGNLLLDLSGDWVYAADETVRKATLHWVGDRKGNVSVPLLNKYAKEMVGYSSLDGVYAYGDAPGQMTLTLDADVQAVALEAMGSYPGSIAVYNYKTGELLCAVTTPTFDPDHVPVIDENDPGEYEGVYLNRFIQSVYIPGSIFKIVTLAAALEAVEDIESQTFVCTGKYTAKTGNISCERSHGTQSLKEAFANSCNCSFAQITEQLGADAFGRYVDQLEVLDPVSFDGFTSAAGNVDLEDLEGAGLAWSGIGQHRDQVNLCGFLKYLGAIANDGVGVEPYIVSEITVGNKVTYRAKTKTDDRILATGTAQILQEYMNNNVETKYGAGNFPGLTVCGKTGTAEVGGDKAANAMFAGFLLDEEYPLAFMVAVEGGGYGSHTCIPILQKVLAACTDAMDG